MISLILGVLMFTPIWSTETDSLAALYNKPVYDGPYIFFEDDSILVMQIEADSVIIHRSILEDKQNIYISSINRIVNISRNFQPEKQLFFNNIAKYIVISDIHGQFNLFRDLLINNGVTDTDLNWTWDSGHLVIAGDVFDRGEYVTETIWLIYALSQQAEASGGKVHYLMGNHELMIIENDLRYLHEKYFKAAKLLNLDFENLYYENSLLGNWLRTIPVCLQINNDLIVHAGLSPWITEYFNDLNSINELMQSVFRRDIQDEKAIELLTGSYGPLWYRGYFYESSKYDKITDEQFIDILADFNVEKIIVGHTSLENIYTFYNGKLIAVDASMKLGIQGKGLLYNNGIYNSIDNNGKSEELQEIKF